jgi:hypothetical protein
VTGAVVLAALSLGRATDDAFGEVGFRVAAVALLALVAGIVLGWPSLVPASLVLLGGMYGAELAVDDAALDAAAPLFAAVALLSAELGYWSIEESERVKGEPGESPRRLAFVAALGLGALVLGGLLLALVDAVSAGGLAFDLVGAAAAAAVLLAIVGAARGRDRMSE